MRGRFERYVTWAGEPYGSGNMKYEKARRVASIEL